MPDLRESSRRRTLARSAVPAGTRRSPVTLRRPGRLAIGVQRPKRELPARRGVEAFSLACVPRPLRFAIVVPVTWRPCGADDWHEGVSVDVSRSGLLIETDRMAATGTLVEFIIALSRVDTPEDEVADVIGVGRVVR